MRHQARTRLMGALAAAVLSSLLVGCAGTGKADDAGGTATTVAATERRPVIERFDGTVDAFYEVPEPLPHGEPGQLIRVQDAGEKDGRRTQRIMYHSRDSEGRDRAATGIVTGPTTAAPDGGWPILVNAPGTIGLSSTCALSRQGRPAPTFGVDGIGVVADYIGMGPVGETQAYLSRLSEGHSVLDAARAARELLGDEAGERLLLFGHSQGGHGAEAAHELAASYAPELQLLGTVSGAPAAMFDRSYGGIDDVVSRIVTTLGLYGVATDHPEVVPSDYLGDAALEQVDVVLHACLGEVISTLAPLAVSPTYWKADPVTTEPVRSVLLANDVGNEVADAPLLLISGTADARVVHQRVMNLFDRLCHNGQVTELIVLEGATHDNEIELSMDRIVGFFADRLAGTDPTDSCTART
jgi:pimeloyl-ACP methyl ester carboxylesterase